MSIEHNGKVCPLNTKIGKGLTATVFRVGEGDQSICVKKISKNFYGSEMGKKLIDN